MSNYEHYWHGHRPTSGLRWAVIVSLILHGLLVAGTTYLYRGKNLLDIPAISPVMFIPTEFTQDLVLGGTPGAPPPPPAPVPPKPEPPKPEPPKVEPPKAPEPEPAKVEEPKPKEPEKPKEKPKVEKPKPEKKPKEVKEAAKSKDEPKPKSKKDAQKEKEKKKEETKLKQLAQAKPGVKGGAPIGVDGGKVSDQLPGPGVVPGPPKGPGISIGEGLPTVLNTWSSMVQSKIQRVWQVPDSARYRGATQQVVLSFWVNRDGHVLGEPQVIKVEGSAELSDSAVAAVKAAVPLPRLPESFEDPEVQVVCTFVPTE